MSYRNPPYRRFGGGGGGGGGMGPMSKLIFGDPEDKAAERDFKYQRQMAEFEAQQAEEERRFKAEQAAHERAARMAEKEQEGKNSKQQERVKARQDRKTNNQKHNFTMVGPDGIMMNPNAELKALNDARIGAATKRDQVRNESYQSGRLNDAIFRGEEAGLMAPVARNIKEGTVTLPANTSAVMPFGATGRDYDKPSMATGVTQDQQLIQTEGMKDKDGNVIIPGKTETVNKTLPGSIRPIVSPEQLQAEAAQMEAARKAALAAKGIPASPLAGLGGSNYVPTSPSMIPPSPQLNRDESWYIPTIMENRFPGLMRGLRDVFAPSQGLQQQPMPGAPPPPSPAIEAEIMRRLMLKNKPAYPPPAE